MTVGVGALALLTAASVMWLLHFLGKYLDRRTSDLGRRMGVFAAWAVALMVGLVAFPSVTIGTGMDGTSVILVTFAYVVPITVYFYASIGFWSKIGRSDRGE